MRCVRPDEKRAKGFPSRVLPVEQVAPQCQCLIAPCGFVSAWKFSGLDDEKCLGQCDLFLRPLRIQCCWLKRRRNFASAPKFAERWSELRVKSAAKRSSQPAETSTGLSCTPFLLACALLFTLSSARKSFRCRRPGLGLLSEFCGAQC